MQSSILSYKISGEVLGKAGYKKSIIGVYLKGVQTKTNNQLCL